MEKQSQEPPEYRTTGSYQQQVPAHGFPPTNGTTQGNGNVYFVPGSSYYSPPPQPSAQEVNLFTKKSVLESYILAVAFGYLGGHHYYLGKYRLALLYTFSLGLGGVGYIVDLFRLPCLVGEINRRKQDGIPPQKINLFEAYLTWFPFGLLGFHHFYLGRPLWGVLYLFTFGLLGFGWIVDAFRMPSLVAMANKEDTLEPQPKNLCTAYGLCFPPVGLLGIQHFYLGRHGFGVLYLFTLGFFGIGWLVDLFRMPSLVRDVNNRIQNGDDRTKRLDDVYILCFPLGFLGLHHFYLRRPVWGTLYACTLGCLGIGWIIDWFRLPCLVHDYNKKVLIFVEIVRGNQQNTTQSYPHIPPSTNVYPNSPICSNVNSPVPQYGSTEPSAPVGPVQPPSYEDAVLPVKAPHVYN